MSVTKEVQDKFNEFQDAKFSNESGIPQEVQDQLIQIQLKLNKYQKDQNRIEIIVSEEDWFEYRKVQDIGMFNMLDSRARELTNLSREQWMQIINHYDMFVEVYGKKKGGAL